MDKTTFFALVAVCTITHIIRLIYEILKHKNKLKAGKLSFIIVFIDMALLWTSWFMLCSMDISRVEPVFIVRFLGILLSIAGFLVFIIALFTIKTLESYEGDLMTKGIYSKIRHPMYLGFILWLIGYPLIYGAIFSSAISIIFIANVLFWRYLEEKELIKRYPAYQDYKKTTLF